MGHVMRAAADAVVPGQVGDEGDMEGIRRQRILLGAFGDPGHAFPMIALGRALAARGHEVTLQTWERWRTPVEAEGVRFAAAPEYHVFPNGPEPLDFYEAVVHATRDTLPLVRELEPEVVVADILTLAPALAAELQEVPVASSSPTCTPNPRRAPRSTRSAPACRAQRSAAPSGDGPRGLSSTDWSTAGRTSTPCASASACRHSATSTAASAGSWRWWEHFLNSSTRVPRVGGSSENAAGAQHPRGRPADLGAPPPRTSSSRQARTRSC